METESTTENLPATDLFKFDIRVGTILSIDPVEKSKKLLKLEVSFGPVGTRTILAGVASAFPNRIMVGQKVVAVLNLVPRVMMGLTSHGMLLAVHDEQDQIWMVSPGGPIPDGAKVG
jgi:methionine--tRNA ligase beta chain